VPPEELATNDSGIIYYRHKYFVPEEG